MYRLLLVDDEEIERNGMAELIPWKDYDVELVGTAQNGKEGLQKIEELKPEIVITDVKMPIMDGIEMIKNAQNRYTDISYIVLSGYGEYQYTSRAMEEGVKHYILKPCDEKRIADIMEEVKKEIQLKRQKQKEENQVRRTVHRLLPKAKQQIFRNILINDANVKDEYEFFMNEMNRQTQNYFITVFRTEKRFDSIMQFSLSNIFNELMGEQQVILSTSIDNEMIFLLKEDCLDAIEEAANKTMQTYSQIYPLEIRVARSECGKMEDVDKMYHKLQHLFSIAEAEHFTGFLSYGMFENVQNQMSQIVAYNTLWNTTSYEDILFELYVSFQKMDLMQYTLNQKVKFCNEMMTIIFKRKEKAVSADATTWSCMEEVVDNIAESKELDNDKEEKRKRLILQAIYQNLKNPELNIQFLAKEVFFMNIDYFGRIFTKLFHVKFTEFLLERRIEVAKRLIQFNVHIKTSDVAELVGYASDGQYFSKAFRKMIGMTPSEYRESLQSTR